MTPIRVCSKCRSDKTYPNKDYWDWRHDKDGNMICKRCYNQEWYSSHREECLEYSRIKYLENRDYKIIQRRLWNLENPDYNKIWYLEHPDYQKVRALERLAT